MGKTEKKIFFLILAVGLWTSWLFLYPATELLVTKNQNLLVSSGSDSLTIPLQASILLETAKDNPSALLKPVIRTDRLNAPEGTAIILGWFERGSLLLGAALFPLEQAQNFQVHLLVLLNIFLFFLFARRRNWPSDLSLAFSFCFALTPFLRARATVHPMYVGIFPILALFLGLDTLKKNEPRAVVYAAAWFFLVATAPQYTQLCLFFLTPFILVWYVEGASLRQRMKPLLLSLVPALCLTIYSFLGVKSIPGSPLPSVASPGLAWQFWEIFSSSPGDYLSGDLLSLTDWNPLRHFFLHEGGFFHEHANGLRWTILFLLPVAVWQSPKVRRRETHLFLAMLVWSFWSSLGPRFFSPATLLHFALPEFRVANRFGPFVLFFLLLLVGEWLQQNWEKWRASIKFFLLALFILEIMPTSPLPVVGKSQIPSALDASGCGTILALPYISLNQRGEQFYWLSFALAHTDCHIVNRSRYEEFSSSFVQNLGANDLKCLGVRWIYNLNQDKSLCQRFQASPRGADLCEMPGPWTAKPFAECVSVDAMKNKSR